MSNNNSERVVRRGRVFPEMQSTEEEKAKHRAPTIRILSSLLADFSEFTASVNETLLWLVHCESNPIAAIILSIPIKKWPVKKQGQNIPTKSIISLALMKLELVAEYD
jgi:hypothetical protein